jgi:DNA replication protein DnaC
MLYEQTISKLYAMKLNGMAESLEEQRKHPQIAELSFEDRIGMIVDKQWIWRENRSLTTRLNFARLKQSVCIEDIDYRHQRSLSREVINQMASSDWVKYHQNCIITGPTGVGKTYLACALAHKACRDGYRALYYYAPKLFRELTMARADGSLCRVLKKLAKVDVLVVDDWGLETLKDSQYKDFLEITDDRHGSGATLITSQFAISSWHEIIGNPTVADALLDRLIHHAHRIELTGESMRKTKGEQQL